jgi:hypothetical protein
MSNVLTGPTVCGSCGAQLAITEPDGVCDERFPNPRKIDIDIDIDEDEVCDNGVCWT